MTPVAADEIAFGIGYGSIFNPEGSGDRHLCQRGARQILSMACLATALVVLVVILMAIVIPAGIVDVVETMRAIGRKRQTSWLMAGGAFDDGTHVSLQYFRGHVVLGTCIRIGPHGMCAAMTTFTHNLPMPLAEAIEGSGFFSKSFV